MVLESDAGSLQSVQSAPPGGHLASVKSHLSLSYKRRSYFGYRVIKKKMKIEFSESQIVKNEPFDIDSFESELLDIENIKSEFLGVPDRDGQGTGRDSPMNFCPGPDCPVAMSLGPGPDHEDLRDGIPTLSRDNRPSLPIIITM